MDSNQNLKVVPYGGSSRDYGCLSMYTGGLCQARPPQPPRQTYNEMDVEPGALYYPKNQSVLLVAPKGDNIPPPKQPAAPAPLSQMPGAVPIPAWFESMWPFLKQFLSETCLAASNQEFIGSLVAKLIAAHPKTLYEAKSIIQQACEGLNAPSSPTQALPPTVPRTVVGSIDMTMDDQDSGMGYGKFYANVDNYWYSTMPILRPYPPGVIAPGAGLSSSNS